MLNELYQLSKALDRNGIILSSIHPDIQAPQNQDGLIVYLNAKGEVSDIEYCEAERFSGLWNYGDGNHNKFPTIKLQFPLLFDPKDSEKFRGELEKKKLLPHHIKQSLLNDIESLDLFIKQETEVLVALNKLENGKWERLHERNKEREVILTKTKDVEIRPFQELLKRFFKNSDLKDFIISLLNIIKTKIDVMSFDENEKKDSKSSKWKELNLLFNILKGKKWDTNKNIFRSEIQIALDLDDYENYDSRILNSKMKVIVSRNLFPNETTINNELKQISSICSISGKKQELVNDKFPNPKLPLLGPSYLFSVNENTPCQNRYNQSSTNIIPVGRETSQSLSDSLTWITSEEREGITWEKVPGRKSNDLLIVYIEDKPNIKISFAKAFGNSDNPVKSESRFENATESLLQALRFHEEIKQESKLKLFIINKVDDGRRQVIQDRTFTVGELKQAIVDWKKAVENSFTIQIPESKFENIKNPYIPLPAEFLQIFQIQWTWDTKNKNFKQTKIPVSISMSQVYDLFLNREYNLNNQCIFYLQLLWQRSSNLVIECAHSLHRNKYFERFKKPEDTRYILQIISAFNIILYKLNLRKEDLMKNPFFLIGQFLSLADTLHQQYCLVKRNGSIPPQLLGNAHFQVVLQNPSQGFARLAERIPVYQAWAMTDKSNESNLAKWALKHLGIINKQLSEVTFPKSANDQEKAILLMGYLAKIEGDKNE